MADLSSVTDNYLPTASETFTDNLSSSISAEAAIVPVNSAVEYADGDTVVLTVAPGTANEATFVGKKDVGNNQFIECIWTEGNTSVGHDAGTTIIDYDSATHYNLLSEALQLIMNQDGTLKDDPIRTALGLSDASNDGWEVFPYTFTVSSGYNKGQNEYELTVANQDVTTLLSPGMRLRLERATTAPTQCADLEVSSSHYASKTTPSGITFTDDFTCEAWVKLESYDATPTNNRTIISRRNAAVSGFGFAIDAYGLPYIYGISGSAVDVAKAYQSIPLNKWTHVAGTLDMSASTGVIYINGISMTVQYTNSGATSLTQAGDLIIGSVSGSSEFFDGKISDVRVWSAIRTQTEIRDNMNQALTGSETNLVAYFPLNGNFEDSTSNNNDLTPSGGVLATSVDNPFNDTQYAIVTKVAYSAPNSTVTVYSGNANVVPNMVLASPYYSVQKVPFGFPSARSQWDIVALLYVGVSATVATGVYVNPGGYSIHLPIGDWALHGLLQPQQQNSSAAGLYARTALSTSTSDPSDYELMASFVERTSSTSAHYAPVHIYKPVSVTASEKYYAIISPEAGAGTITMAFAGSLAVDDEVTNAIRAEFTLL